MTTQRARQAVGGTRVSAFWRLVGAIVLLTIDAFLTPIALVAGVLYMVVDIAKSFAVDKNASSNGMILGALKGIFMWVIDLHKWVLFGREFPGFIPSRR